MTKSVRGNGRKQKVVKRYNEEQRIEFQYVKTMWDTTEGMTITVQQNPYETSVDDTREDGWEDSSKTLVMLGQNEGRGMKCGRLPVESIKRKSMYDG